MSQLQKEINEASLEVSQLNQLVQSVQSVQFVQSNNKPIEPHILDPLSVIIKLAILSKKPVGSKITIGSNVIYLQEVGIFQGLVRFVYKVRKDEIQYLYNPIEIASNKYLSDYYIKQYPRLQNLFKNAINGLDKLIDTYKQNIIFTHALFMYESLIKNNLLSKDQLTSPIYNPLLFKNDSITSEYNKDVIDSFCSVWTDERINIVLNLIEFIDTDCGYDKSIKCLEDFMNIVDSEIQKKVNLHNEQTTKLEQTTNLTNAKSNEKLNFPISNNENKIISDTITKVSQSKEHKTTKNKKKDHGSIYDSVNAELD